MNFKKLLALSCIGFAIPTGINGVTDAGWAMEDEQNNEQEMLNQIDVNNNNEEKVMFKGDELLSNFEDSAIPETLKTAVENFNAYYNTLAGDKNNVCSRMKSIEDYVIVQSDFRGRFYGVEERGVTNSFYTYRLNPSVVTLYTAQELNPVVIKYIEEMSKFLKSNGALGLGICVYKIDNQTKLYAIAQTNNPNYTYTTQSINGAEKLLVNSIKEIKLRHQTSQKTEVAMPEDIVQNVTNVLADALSTDKNEMYEELDGIKNEIQSLKGTIENMANLKGGISEDEMMNINKNIKNINDNSVKNIKVLYDEIAKLQVSVNNLDGRLKTLGNDANRKPGYQPKLNYKVNTAPQVKTVPQFKTAPQVKTVPQGKPAPQVKTVPQVVTNVRPF